MFRLPRADTKTVRFAFDDQIITAQTGDSIAAALLAAGHRSFRDTPISGAARGPLCLMGVCFDCLVTVNGAPNQQACMILVRDGMQVRRQIGAAGVVS